MFVGSEELSSLSAERLCAVVRAAIDEPGATVEDWDARTLKRGPAGLTELRDVYLLQGTARVGPGTRPWSVILKLYQPASRPGGRRSTEIESPEVSLYRSGLLDDLPGSLRAPHYLGSDDTADGAVWLWLEQIREEGERRWPLARWALTAQHLGRFNGAYRTERSLPGEPWLTGQRLRKWLDRHGPLVAKIAEAPRNPLVRHWWPPSIVERILRLWDEREVYCTALERLPQTFGHGDAIRRNLFARRQASGTEETVAIDWEHAGYYALGEEVGQTLSVAAAFFDWEPADLPILDEALFEGYRTGLEETGWRGNLHQVRFAYLAHAALRNLFNAVGATVPDEAGRAAARQNYGYAWEDLADRRAAARPFLLECAAKAASLLSGL